MSGIDIEAVKTKVNEFLNKYPVINDPVSKIADKIKLDKAFVAIGFALLPLLIAFFFGYGEFVIDLIGFVYPVYGSIKAIETKSAEDDTLWLTYWLIFGMFKVIEQIADVVISFIPFYFLSKVLFLVWCYYPSTKGASVIYNAVLKPYVVPHLMGEKND